MPQTSEYTSNLASLTDLQCPSDKLPSTYIIYRYYLYVT